MKELFEHLDSFGLGSEVSLENTLRRWGDSELTRFFESYADLASRRSLIYKAELGATDIYPDSTTGLIPHTTIAQLAVYVNRFYIHDPLLDLAQDYFELDTHFERIIRHPEREDRLVEFRRQLASGIGAILRLRPLAEAGIIHITPTQFVRQLREPGAVYSSDMYGPDGQFQASGKIEQPVLALPPRFVEYIENHLRIFPARFEDGQVVIYTDEALKTTRAIAVRFDDETVPRVYCLSSLSVPPNGAGDERVINMTFNLSNPEGDLDERTFRSWVRGECQKYIRQKLDTLQTDLFLACQAKAHFLTTLQSSHDLAGLSMGDSPSKPVTTNTLLKIELPYLDNVTMHDIANARRDEAAFHDFRAAMDNAFKEVDMLEGTASQDRIEEICRDLIHAPLARVDDRMKSLKRNVFIDAALAVGTLITTIVTGGNTLLTIATIATAARALDSYKQEMAEQDKIRQMPSYFYWKLTKRARQQA